MSVIKTGIHAGHDATLSAAESLRQSNVGATQATAKAADIAFYRSAITAARANGFSDAQFKTALIELGTGGS